MKGCKFYLHTNGAGKWGFAATTNDGKTDFCPDIFDTREEAREFVKLLNDNSIRWNVVLTILEQDLSITKEGT